MKLHNEAAKLAHQLTEAMSEAFRNGDIERHHRIGKISEKAFERQYRRYSEAMKKEGYDV